MLVPLAAREKARINAGSARGAGGIGRATGGRAPAGRGLWPRREVVALVFAAALVTGAPAALAEPERDEALAETDNLDGYYLALGPRGGALYTEGEWDGAFGAEVSLYHYQGDRPLSLLGLSGGMVQLSELTGGQLFGEVGAGGSVVSELRAGLAAGVTARTSPVRHPRLGVHATLFAFAGPIAYGRVGSLQDTGMFVDIGIRLALPALRL